MQHITHLCFLLFFVLQFSSFMAQKLLYEPDAPDYKAGSTSQSLFDKLAPDPSLSTFMDVLTQVDDIFNMINHTDNDSNQVFTVFCPVNTAFRNELDIYTRNHLQDFLRNHIVPNSKVDPDMLAKTNELNTLLEGQTITVKHHFFSQKTVLNDHALVDTSHAVEAINGIAYKIDHLLRPTVVKIQ